jgi:hypothetical protein
MATKSIIPIEVDDQSFKAFYDLFQQFQDKLGELPEDWKQVHAAAEGSHEALAGAAGAIVESMVQAKEHARQLASNMKDAVEAQKQFRITTGEGETGLKKMNIEAKELAHTIFGIGKFLFKMSAIGVATAAGSLFGIDKLAEHAVGNQRAARGLGLTTGQLRAFQTDIGSRYMDDNVLESVANARNDLTGRVWLQRALGTSSDQIDKANTGDLAAQLAIKVHDWWASTPQSQHNESFFQSTGFEQSGISLDMARQIGNTDRGELTRARQQYNTDASSLNVSDRSTDALYGFSRQLDLAGRSLETFLTNRLGDPSLNEALGNLLSTLEKDAEVLVNEIFSKENLDVLSHGIDTLTGILGGKEFKDDVKILADGIGQIAKAIMVALRLIAPSTDQGPTTDKDGNPVLEDMESHQTHGLGDRQANGGDTWLGRYFLNRQDYYGGNGQGNATYGGPYYGTINPKTQQGKDNLAYLGGLEKTLKLPEGLLASTVSVESSGIANALSNKGAMGAMQLMPGTAKQYGVTDPNDFAQNVRGGASYYAWLQSRYKGDLRKEIGAYNWGPGNLDKAVAQYGDKWESHAPAETQNQIKQVLALMARNQNQNTVKIEITNKAGANVAVSANAGNG